MQCSGVSENVALLREGSLADFAREGLDAHVRVSFMGDHVAFFSKTHRAEATLVRTQLLFHDSFVSLQTVLPLEGRPTIVTDKGGLLVTLPVTHQLANRGKCGPALAASIRAAARGGG